MEADVFIHRSVIKAMRWNGSSRLRLCVRYIRKVETSLFPWCLKPTYICLISFHIYLPHLIPFHMYRRPVRRNAERVHDTATLGGWQASAGGKGRQLHVIPAGAISPTAFRAANHCRRTLNKAHPQSAPGRPIMCDLSQSPSSIPYVHPFPFHL